MVITVLIDLAASWASEHSDDFSKPVVEILFKELTVLGCIALLVFMSVKTGIPEEISTQVLAVCVHIAPQPYTVHFTTCTTRAVLPPEVPAARLQPTDAKRSKRRVACAATHTLLQRVRSTSNPREACAGQKRAVCRGSAEPVRPVMTCLRCT